MGPTSCSQVKKTGGLNAQELDLGKMCYHFSTFGVGRFIIGVGLVGGMVSLPRSRFLQFCVKREEKNVKIALF